MGPDQPMFQAGSGLLPCIITRYTVSQTCWCWEQGWGLVGSRSSGRLSGQQWQGLDAGMRRAFRWHGAGSGVGASLAHPMKAR